MSSSDRASAVAPPAEDRAAFIDPKRLDELITKEEAAFIARQPRSGGLIKRARRTLAGGVTSSWQIAKPQTIWMSHGEGSKVYDADGHEFVDLHGGYGVMLVGHAHPSVVEAVSQRIRRGSHFAQPTEDAIVVAEELARRFGLPRWRFCNSGTEATMDAVHLMRAATGRDLIVKVEGCYHGHHDTVMVSVYDSPPDIGPPKRPHGVRSGSGLPRAVTDLTVITPFNDVHVLEDIFDEHEGEIAGMILEPVMMNAGIIPPVDGYLQGVRDITRRHGALLAFDEVKTGLAAGPGGATRLFGVTPDLVCLAKAMGGGLPCGAIGGTAELMSLIEEGEYEQVGTFNGNPLTMAAARAALCEVLDEAAYAHIDDLRALVVTSCHEIIERHQIPARVVAVGAKGCITFSESPVRNYRDFLTIDDRLSHLHWLVQHRGGVFLPLWGKAEQWLLSVQHTARDVQRFVDNFGELASLLRG